MQLRNLTRAATRSVAAPAGLVAGAAQTVQRSVRPHHAPGHAGTRRRHVARALGRAHIEVRGLRRADGEAFARALHAALSEAAGVDDAVVNSALECAVVSFDEDSVDVGELVGVVEAVEEQHAASLERRAGPPLPTDPVPLQRQLIALGADVAAIGVSAAGQLLRLPRVPMEAPAALGFVEAAPRLRQPLVRTFGEVPVDVALAMTGAVLRGLAQGISGPATDLALRTVLTREADARLRAWHGRERELHAASGPVVAPPPHAARTGAPLDPNHRYGDISAALGATLAGVAFAGTSNPRRAVGALTAGTAKAARLGPEAFAGSLGRLMADRGVVTVDPAALRLLDQVDAVVIDSTAALSGRFEVSDTVTLTDDVTADELYLRATALIDPLAPDPGLAPPRAGASRRRTTWCCRARRGRGKRCAAGHRPGARFWCCCAARPSSGPRSSPRRRTRCSPLSSPQPAGWARACSSASPGNRASGSAPAARSPTPGARGPRCATCSARATWWRSSPAVPRRGRRPTCGSGSCAAESRRRGAPMCSVVPAWPTSSPCSRP